MVYDRIRNLHVWLTPPINHGISMAFPGSGPQAQSVKYALLPGVLRWAWAPPMCQWIGGKNRLETTGIFPHEKPHGFGFDFFQNQYK